MEKMIYPLNSIEGLSLWLENNRKSYENDLEIYEISTSKDVIPISLDLRNKEVLDIFRTFGTHPDVYIVPLPGFLDINGDSAVVQSINCSKVIDVIQERLDRNLIVYLYYARFCPGRSLNDKDYGVILRCLAREKKCCCCCHGKNK